ncbi:MAG: HAD family phosphatase [Candidatus Aminicenantes bacterium]|nr:HAD family phosphatase [Candidatus Aminicenantes bacterium]
MIKLAIFDMDGTVFESYLNWAEIKENLGIESNILKEIYKNNRVDRVKLAKLEGYEEENTLRTAPIKGIAGFLSFLKSRPVDTALVTNNNKKNTAYLLENFSLRFDTVITREKKLWKPSPDPFFHVMDLYRRDVKETIAIGDSHYDVKAAKEAGIANIFIIKNEVSQKLSDNDIVYFKDYHDLKKILESGLFEKE